MTSTSRPIGTVIPARYRGFCRNCRHSYERGDLIRKAADKYRPRTLAEVLGQPEIVDSL